MIKANNIIPVGTFICEVEPKNGKYFWLIHKNTGTFAGMATSQEEAIYQALYAN